MLYTIDECVLSVIVNVCAWGWLATPIEVLSSRLLPHLHPPIIRCCLDTKTIIYYYSIQNTRPIELSVFLEAARSPNLPFLTSSGVSALSTHQSIYPGDWVETYDRHAEHHVQHHIAGERADSTTKGAIRNRESSRIRRVVVGQQRQHLQQVGEEQSPGKQIEGCAVAVPQGLDVQPPKGNRYHQVVQVYPNQQRSEGPMACA